MKADILTREVKPRVDADVDNSYKQLSEIRNGIESLMRIFLFET